MFHALRAAHRTEIAKTTAAILLTTTFIGATAAHAEDKLKVINVTVENKSPGSEAIVALNIPSKKDAIKNYEHHKGNTPILKISIASNENSIPWEAYYWDASTKKPTTTKCDGGAANVTADGKATITVKKCTANKPTVAKNTPPQNATPKNTPPSSTPPQNPPKNTPPKQEFWDSVVKVQNNGPAAVTVEVTWSGYSQSTQKFELMNTVTDLIKPKGNGETAKLKLPYDPGHPGPRPVSWEARRDGKGDPCQKGTSFPVTVSCTK